MRSKMFATYKGNEYEVQRVAPRLADFELLARKDHELEDIQLGFVRDVYERQTAKRVKREEIEELRVTRTSVYQEFYEEYKIDK